MAQPDTAETIAALLDRRDELDDVARFHFGGHWDPDGTHMTQAIRHSLNEPALPVKALPWWMFKLASPFSETMREIHAVKPLWQTPIQLDNTRLTAFLDEEPHTPLDDAMTTTLTGMGCL